jgi:hypothetical protein
MLLSWMLSDTWLMHVPARLADIALMSVTVWLASRWCRTRQRSYGRALLVSAVNAVLGAILFALFVWVRDTGAVPWRGPLWLPEMFLLLQTMLVLVLVLAFYHGNGWRSLGAALTAVILTGALEAGLIAWLSLVGPHAAGA